MFARSIPTFSLLLSGGEHQLEQYAALVSSQSRKCRDGRKAGCGVLRTASHHPPPSALQVADGYRPPMPAGLPPALAELICSCWKGDPSLRPDAGEVVAQLKGIAKSGG